MGFKSLFLAAGLLASSLIDGAAAAKSAGCGKKNTITSGVHTISSSGANRQYTIYVPASYDNTKPYKLIFGFHWVGGTMADVATGQTVTRDVWSYYGLKRLANDNAIFVAPQGISNGWGNSGGNDITFVKNMVAAFNADLCIETSLTFATGFSYGAAMSYSVACSLASQFRAVAVLSGGALSGCAGGTSPIAYLGIHGVSDGTLNIAGGRTLRDRFVKNNGCASASPTEPKAGTHTHTKYQYTGCSAGHPVTWIAFDGGHIAAPYDGGSGDNGNKAFSPTETWTFFNQFSAA